MASWDIFHADRLELERGLDEPTIRAALARGELRDDDLARPAGTTLRWTRIAEVPELMTPFPPLNAAPAPTGGASPEAASDFEEIQPHLEDIVPPTPTRQPTRFDGPISSSDVTIPVLDEALRSDSPPDPGRVSQAPKAPAWVWDDGEDEGADQDELDEPAVPEGQEDIEILADEKEAAAAHETPGTAARAPTRPAGSATTRQQPAPSRGWEPGEHDLDLADRPDSRSSHVALPVVPSRDRDARAIPDDDADPEAGFSLARSATTRVEELDLAPMVDVAFNLVLFFMVTASTILYKTLEIPKPSGEAPAGAVAQGRSRSLDDLKDDYVLVEIDERGTMKLDREPIEPTMENLVELLRRAREKTGRKAMLLSADFATPHRNAVLAYDAANEIGMGIAIARPQAPLGPAPALRPGAGAVPKRGAEPPANRPS